MASSSCSSLAKKFQNDPEVLMLHSQMVEAGEAGNYDEAIHYQELKEERLTILAT